MDTTIPTRIRLSPATLAALKARAETERRSITVMAGMLLEAALVDPAQDAEPVIRQAEGQGESVGRTGRAHRPTGAIPRHVAGPVLSDPVPRAASGDAVGFNLKGQTKGKGKP